MNCKNILNYTAKYTANIIAVIVTLPILMPLFIIGDLELYLEKRNQRREWKTNYYADKTPYVKINDVPEFMRPKDFDYNKQRRMTIKNDEVIILDEMVEKSTNAIVYIGYSEKNQKRICIKKQNVCDLNSYVITEKSDI